MLRCRALFCAGRLADARAEAEATIEMADEIGDGSYGYINHVGLYVLGRVALHTGDTAGLAQARRSAARLRQAPEPARPASAWARWLMAMVADAEGDRRRRRQGRTRQVLDPLADWAAVRRAARGRTRTPPRSPASCSTRAGARRRSRWSRRLEDFAGAAPGLPVPRQRGTARARGARRRSGHRAAGGRAERRRSPAAGAGGGARGRRAAAARQPRAAEAVPLLETALASYAAAGAERDAARVRSLLRARGVRPPTGGPRSAPEWPELTESEFAVVSLVAQGATNREVADRLFLSPYTVNSHLRHVFAKLGIRSRVELARLASSRGMPAGGN